jgi:hypothetical protein
MNRPKTNRSSTKVSAPAFKILRLMLACAVACALLLGSILVAVPAISPAAGAATADFLRSVVGPEPVAQLESASYWLRDLIVRNLAAAGAVGPGVEWAGGTTPNPPALSSQPPSYTAIPTVIPSNLGEVPDLSPNAAGSTGSPPPPDPILDPPSIGWQGYGPAPQGRPLMARAMVMVDASRSYAGVALVRMDLTRLALHIVPGFIEPAHPSGIDQQIPDIGMVAPQDTSRLVAAFNGGFKALHGHYGMMVNGFTLLQPKAGMGTVAEYRNGNVLMGTWGVDLAPSPDIIALRQNCPPLIAAGTINPALSTDARGAWGFTSNSDVTWRTGLGITQDGRYLIYAVGNGTNARFLAEALLKAGAYNAMQLDINQFYAHFVTYTPGTAGSSPAQLQAQPLLKEMIDIRALYLVPEPRDFFYLTSR